MENHRDDNQTDADALLDSLLAGWAEEHRFRDDQSIALRDSLMQKIEAEDEQLSYHWWRRVFTPSPIFRQPSFPFPAGSLMLPVAAFPQPALIR